MTEEVTPAVHPLYLGSVLTQFENGVQLDLRAKLAVDFIKAGVHDAAKALDIATAFIAEAEKRGMLKALPDTDDLSAPMRRHIRQNVRAQIYQQVAAQQIQAEEMPAVAQARGPMKLA